MISNLLDPHVRLAHWDQTATVGVGRLEGRLCYYAAAVLDDDELAYLIVLPEQAAHLQEVLDGQRPLLELLDGTVQASYRTVSFTGASAGDAEPVVLDEVPAAWLPRPSVRLTGLKVDLAGAGLDH